MTPVITANKQALSGTYGCFLVLTPLPFPLSTTFGRHKIAKIGVSTTKGEWGNKI